jgi:hypothetical protein
MGIVRMGVPEELVLFMRRMFGLNMFIETGTFKGDTSCWAANHFEKVHTIEFSKELYSEASNKYRHRENINFIFGDSSKELHTIMQQIDSPAVFWLDAHHCSLNTSGKGVKASILDEIDAIASSKYDHFILIDDARLFLAPPPEPHPLDEYPDIYTLLERVNRRKRKYILIYNDVIICVPMPTKELISGFCKKEITQNDKLFWAGKSTGVKNGPTPRLLAQGKSAIRKVRNLLIQSKNTQQKLKKFDAEFHIFQSLNKKNSRFPCHWADRYPCLEDATANTDYNRHYVLHPAWAMRILAKTKPDLHFDISSTLRFVAQLSCILPVKHYDYRPPLLSIDNLECGQVNLMDLPFPDNSIKSLSCMHAIEHIGLGRYGDPLDSDGDIKAASELARVLAFDGNLLFVVPVGSSKIAFNAHRIYSYRQALDLFPTLQINQYALIPDSHDTGDILYNASEALTDSQFEGCGCFWFIKK